MINKPEDSAGQKKYNQLREEYPFMEFSGFEANVDSAGLHVKYNFNLADKFIFNPGFSIPRKRFYTHFPTAESLETPLFQNLIFQIGMIELISYWKATCSPKVIIKGQKLSAD